MGIKKTNHILTSYMNLDMSNKVNSGSQTILLASGTNGDGNFSL
jgi:hypothetical protein